LTGFTPGDLVGRRGSDFVHPDDIGLVNESYQWALGERHRIRSPSFRVIRKDGTHVWIESLVRPVLDPQTGEVLEMQASSRDMTERVRVEAKLASAHSELQRQTAALR